MAELGFWARLWLAIVLFWKVLVNQALAQRARLLLPSSAAEPRQTLPSVAAIRASDPTPALQLLSIMQREGRLIDFLQEDVSSFSDAEVGAAARVVHEGCKRGLREYVVLEPVRPEPEGAAVVLERGFDAAGTRVTGNVVGEPPFRGRLAHHGWRVADIHLPSVTDGHDPQVVAPAEVEL
jgi:hypothetical protein